MTTLKRVTLFLLRIMPLIIGIVAILISLSFMVITFIFNNTAVPVDANVDAVSGQSVSLSWVCNGASGTGVVSIDTNELQLDVGDLATIWVCPVIPKLFSVHSMHSSLSSLVCVMLSACMLICGISLFKSDRLKPNTENSEG